MTSSRMLFTCRPLSGHFDPLLPLAAAARAAGHTVAFASGDPVVGRARDCRLHCVRGRSGRLVSRRMGATVPGLHHAGRRRSAHVLLHRDLRQPWSWYREPLDLESIMSEWQPDLVVHEVAELAAPLVCTALGDSVRRRRIQLTGAAGLCSRRPARLQPCTGEPADSNRIRWPACSATCTSTHVPRPCRSPRSPTSPTGAVQRMRPAVGEAHGAPTTGLARRPAAPTHCLRHVGHDLEHRSRRLSTVIEALADRVNLIVTVGRQNDPAMLGPQPRLGDRPQSTSRSTSCCRGATPSSPTADRARCSAPLAHGRAAVRGSARCRSVEQRQQIVNAGAGRRLLRDELTVRRCT